MPRFTAYYEFLGVSSEASADDIRKAYKIMVPQLHPDKNPDREEDFKKLQRVYGVLNNKEKRSLYDRGGEEAVERGPSIFEQMGKRQEKGEDFVSKIGVELEDLYKGVSKKLRVNKKMICSTCKGLGSADRSKVQPCRQCNGRGRVLRMMQHGFMMQQVAVACPACEGSGEFNSDPCSTCHSQKTVKGSKEITLVIDPGQTEGQKVVIRGEADEEPGAQAGDLVFIIHQMPHAVFTRKESDLYVKKTISLREALTGVDFKIAHLDGRILHIKTEPGDIIRPGVSRYIAGEGMPAHKQIFNKGKLFIDFEVVFPTKGQLNAEQIAALTKALPASAASQAAAPALAVPAAGQALEEVELVDISVEALSTLEKERETKKRPTQETEEDEEEEDPRHGPGVQCAHQ
jgi:DnaJ-class molecular chaperone